jgi:seryl-tRNA synthetase
MLDIGLVRENPAVVEKDLRKRRALDKLKWLDNLLRVDAQWRRLKKETDDLRHERNEIARQINQAKKSGQSAGELLRKAKQLPAQLAEKEGKMRELMARANYYLRRLPNITHDSVPYGRDESENVVVKTWGKKPKRGFEVKHHGQLAVELGLADFERAVKISGAGFFFLKGDLALLDLALQRFAIDFLVKRGFTLLQTPHMMRREPYEGVTDLADFKTVMYKVDGEDLFLIATSEHPIAAMYMNEILEEEQLPMKLCGISPCYRREIGKHGLDERGFFRVHQFNKVEQFIFCKPEESWQYFEELAQNPQDMLKELGIPFNVTNICTGDIGVVAAKKYDINAYSPREGTYIEVMSCSNCTDYQARRLNIRYRKRGGEKKIVHTLNNTMIATTRFLRVLIENYQTRDGTIKVPGALQSYMGGAKEIPSPR